MKLVSPEEGIVLRAKSLYAESQALLEQDNYQGATLVASDIKNQCPGRMEGHLMAARISYRKAKILGQPRWLLESKKSYKAVLETDPANQEARQRLEELEALKISSAEMQAWYDQDLGTEAVMFQECQAGYHPRGTKSVVVWTLAEFTSGRFRVVDKLTGAVEFSGALEKKGQYAWKRWHWVAEFSRLAREGDYILEVEFANGPRAASHEFRIAGSVYAGALRLSLEGYFNHRCGQDLAYRKGCNDGPVCFCHPVHDAAGHSLYWKNIEAVLQALPEPLNIRGGWHDGGNWERVASNMITNLFCLLLGHKHAPVDWHRYREKAPDTLVEARYGADYFLSCWDAVGSAHVDTFLAVLGNTDDGRQYVKKMIQHVFRWEPGIIHCADLSRVRKTRGAWIPWYARLYGPALAFFALLYRPHDAALAAKCAEVAAKLQAFHREPDPGETITISTTAAIALGDMYLWQLTGAEQYRLSAARAVESILAFQAPDGFFPFEGIEHSALCLAGFYPQIALFEYADIFKTDPLRGRIIACFERFMPWIERLSSIAPYGQMMEYKQENPRNCFSGINGHSPNAYYGYVAIVCLLANRLLQTKKYTAIAERQVQWLFGRNPKGVCMMGAAGWRNGSQHLMDTLSNGRWFRHVPGYVSLGIAGREVEGFGNDYPYFPMNDVDGCGEGFNLAMACSEGGGMTEGPYYAALALLNSEFGPAA